MSARYSDEPSSTLLDRLKLPEEAWIIKGSLARSWYWNETKGWRSRQSEATRYPNLVYAKAARRWCHGRIVRLKVRAR